MDDYVLIVDDDQEAYMLMDSALAAFGLNARYAPDGRQALHMVCEQPPSLIILDLLMPQMSGLTTLKRLRRIPASSSIPVIIVSGMVKSSEIEPMPNVLGTIDKTELTLDRLYRLLQRAGLLGEMRLH